jgi:DnaJ-like protein
MVASCGTISPKFFLSIGFMALNEHNRRKFVAGMSRRIAKLRDQSEQSLDFAIETMFQERTEAYLHVEQGLIEVDRMLGLVEGELEDITELTTAQRLESRLEFIEDRFEEFESEIRQRPRRRRHKINLFNFFKAAGGSGGEGEPTSVRGEIRSSVQAYEVLGVEFGSPLPVVTRAFRERAKKIHPDIRQGDRSSEPELRRIIEAYQFLKTDYFGSTASDSMQRPF